MTLKITKILNTLCACFKCKSNFFYIISIPIMHKIFEADLLIRYWNMTLFMIHCIWKSNSQERQLKEAFQNFAIFFSKLLHLGAKKFTDSYILPEKTNSPSFIKIWWLIAGYALNFYCLISCRMPQICYQM